MAFFHTSNNAFGLDISDRCLRLVQLKKTGGKTSVQLFNEVALPPECLKSGEIIQPDVFLKSLKKLIKTCHGRGQLNDKMIAVLPEDKTFLKILEIPEVTEKEIAAEINRALPENIPIDISEVYSDFQILKQDGGSQTVLVGTAMKKTVDSYVDLITKAGLTTVALEIEAAAISRILLEKKEDLSAQMVIDMGASRTGLFVYDNGIIKFTVSIPISGNQITQTIMSALDLDFNQAEQAKIVCGLDPNKCRGALLEIFSQTVEDLAGHIRQAMDFYCNNFKDENKISKITLTGGGSNFINIGRLIEEKMGLPTAIANPWTKIKNPDLGYFDANRSQSFTTALGLALRGLCPKTFI